MKIQLRDLFGWKHFALLLAVSIPTALPVVATSSALSAERKYPLGADSQQQEGVPQGILTEYELLESEQFPGTVRRYYVYVPAQYTKEKPASLLVFQDGHAYSNRGGEYRVPTVLDNLIHRGELPVTIALFVDPGHKKEQLPDKPGWQPTPENRSFEYDTLSADYVTFLEKELLPKLESEYNIAKEPAKRVICGASSGGICAFTAAWHRPDLFGGVISHIGSFTNIRHGDTYPGIIRKTDKKPIRVYLQDGVNDLDNLHGNWWLGNLQMEAALKFKGYDVRLDRGEGAHNGNHGGSLMPDALRWIWRDHPEVKSSIAVLPDVQTAEWAVSWWKPRHEAKIAERKANPKVELLMVGDSITHGWEGAGRAAWDKFYASRKPLNIGFSGDRTENVIWRIQNGAIDDIQPKLAVIMIGTNNTGHRQDPAEQTAAGIQRIISEIHLRTPNTKVLLLGIFPRGETADDPLRKLNLEINSIVKNLADDQKVWYLDISDRFLDAEGKLPKDIMPDLLHPNEKGYEIWADAMEPDIKRLLGE